MTTSIAVLVAGLAPLATLIYHFEHTQATFVPPQDETPDRMAHRDVRVRRLTEELQAAETDPARRAVVYAGLLRGLEPAVRHTLNRPDLTTEIRERLAATGQNRTRWAHMSTAQIERLLSDLENS